MDCLFFQPKYINSFKCDGSKCNASCCRGWNISIDKNTYARYPKEFAAHLEFNTKSDAYLVMLDEKKSCPFLTADKLCRIQLDYGEEFLSLTCRTFPRQICFFGKFFEVSLSLSCPVAVKMILFREEPIEFEILDVPREFINNKLVNPVRVDKKFSAHIIEIQLAMISILQARMLNLDQRLIALGLFLDRLDEISSPALDEDALKNLVATYESKKFLSEKIPRLIPSFTFDVQKFSKLMIDLFAKLSDDVSLAAQIIKNYERLNPARKKIRVQLSTFLENFLVNEIFRTFCPWLFESNIAANFGFLVAKYKIFELMILTAALSEPLNEARLIYLIVNFDTKINHLQENQRKILRRVAEEGDIFNLIETLLEGSD